MITSLLGLTICAYGCYRWAQTAKPAQMVAWGIVGAATLPMLSKMIVFSLHDWDFFPYIALAAVSVIGVVLLIVGIWRWLRERDSYLTTTLR